MTARSQSPYSNGPAKLPALPTVRLTDPQMQRFVDALRAWVDTRSGATDPFERAVTLRDLVQLGIVDQATVTNRSLSTTSAHTPPSVLVQTSTGVLTMTMEAFAKSIFDSVLFRDLVKRLDDPTRFERLPKEIQAILLRDIADEAAARGADIRRLESKLQDTNKSLAYTVAEVTASVEGSMAGVRETVFAYATEGAAQAGKITQIQARIDGVPIDPASIDATVHANLAALESAVPIGVRGIYYQVDNPSSALNDLYLWNGSSYYLAGRGTTALGGTATLEEQMTASASRETGLEAQYTLKVSAGKAVAGFGIAATERDGVAESAFIIQADKFALTASYDFAQESTPSATAIGDTWYKPSTQVSYRATATGTGSWVAYTPVIPFGVDMENGTVYINGNVRIGTGSGTPLNSVGAGESNIIVFAYQRATAAPSVPSVDATYNFTTKALTGLNNGWTATIPAGANPLYITSATAASTTGSDTIATGDWTTPVILAQDGEAASAGANSAVAYLYRRTATSTPPSTPTGSSPTNDLTYTFATGALTGTPPTDWSITIPSSGGDYLWESRAVAFAVATTDTILPTEWSTAKLFSQNGINGGAGKSTYLASVYTRFSSAPAAPVASTGSFNFGTNTLTAPTSAVPASYTWSAGIPSGSNPVYVSTFLFSITGDSGSVTAGTWSTPVLFAQNGTTGNYTDYVFKRSATLPAKPVAADPSGEGWLDAPPVANGNPLWTAIAEKTAAGALVGVWGDPVQIEGGTFKVQYSANTGGPWFDTFTTGHLYAHYSTNGGLSYGSAIKIVGEDGDQGTAGQSTYLYTVFRRDTANPSVPSGGYYDFGTNTGSPPASPAQWYNAPPSGSNQLYMSTTIATGIGPTAIDTTLTWSGPQPVANRGSLIGYSNSNATAVYSTNPWNGTTDDNNAAKVIWMMLGNSAASFVTNTTSHLVPGDTVTLKNSGGTASATRMWIPGSPGTWGDPGVVIDGNLVVNGTLGADKIGAGTITAAVSLNTGGYLRVSGGVSQSLTPAEGGAPTSETVAAIANTSYTQTFGLVGLSSMTGGVYGYNSDTTNVAKAGVLGRGPTGVKGYSSLTNGWGVVGSADGSADAVGVYGLTLQGTAVKGQASLSGIGVWGAANSGTGVRGVSSTGFGGWFSSIKSDGQITSTLATGTAPLVVASTTQVANLNVSQLQGKVLGSSGAWWDKIAFINSGGILDGVGRIDFHTANTETDDFNVSLVASGTGLGTGSLSLYQGDNTPYTVLAGVAATAGASPLTAFNVPTGRGTVLKWLKVPVPTALDASGFIYIPYV